MTDDVSGNGKQPTRIRFPGGEGERALEFQLLKDTDKGYTAIAVKDSVNGHVISETILPDESMIREAEILGHDPNHPLSTTTILFAACQISFSAILTALQMVADDE